MANESQRLYELLTNRLTALRAGYLDELVAGGGMHDALIADAAGANIAADIIALKAETVLILEDTGTTIPGAMALASVLGALNTAAAEGAVTDADEAMAYIKQLVTELIVVDGIVDDILADTVTISGGALPVNPVLNSLARFIASGGTALGWPLPDSMSLIDLLGDFTGAHDGGAQDDNVKASLDLAHTDLDSIITELGKVPKSDAAVSWNATALAAIEAEAVDALESFDLDHLMTVVMGAALDTFVLDDTVLGFILAKSDVSTFDRTTDSLEAISEAIAGLSEAGLKYGTPIDGSVTPTDGTENDIVATDGTGDWAQDFEIFLSIDLSVMGASDTVVIKVYKTVDGTNERLADTQEFSGVQTIEVWEMDALWGDENMDVRVTLAQTAKDGGYKTFEYHGSVRKPSS